jgi:hypothetical protein
MSTPTRLALAVGSSVAIGATLAAFTASAAELLTKEAPVRGHALVAPCGPCGYLHRRYVYHAELRSTYGTGFDPRNFDLTQPYYYFGPVRAYPRYWVSPTP